MFPGFSINQRELYCSSEYVLSKNSEDDHYEEEDEESFSLLEDGIALDESIIDEYEDCEEEMEEDTPELVDPESIKSQLIDDIEAEHYDSFDDE